MIDNKDIIFEDDYLLVINKPAGILTVPTNDNEKNTLTNQANKILEKRGLNIKVLPCHRLDRDTSGLIIYAKDKIIQEKIMDQFRNNQVRKRYIAFVDGALDIASGTVSFPIENKKAITKYKLLQKRKGYSIIKVEALTGRTNQIRIHFKMIGHPLLGERKFAFGKDFKVKFRRTALHASEIHFRHPCTNQKLYFFSRLPDDMSRLIGGQIK